MRASGRHYSTQHEQWQPRIVGGDGIGITRSGARVYGIGIGGAIAETAFLIDARWWWFPMIWTMLQPLPCLSAELILDALKGNGGFSPKIRYITVGAMSGDKIQLSSSVLRSTDLQIFGSGIGSWTEAEVSHLFAVITPETFRLAAAGKLKVDTESISLPQIEKLWDAPAPGGKRLVVVI